jgi:hypothetical protein
MTLDHPKRPALPITCGVSNLLLKEKQNLHLTKRFQDPSWGVSTLRAVWRTLRLARGSSLLLKEKQTLKRDI